ncbi:unnamed protein product [Oikopleura dioica]|uniref:Protein kinase domain-containing protein n=1 Tax=Oikopleura dioica TaxID=34765 RepID=E4XPZ4_OIKDI|nr:unnamed protein product [Oikopleura dioica]
MLTEFCFLAALTLNEDERAVLRGEIDEWLKYFLPKLGRESTRTEKCRLIASVERQEFERNYTASKWRFCMFVGEDGIIFNDEKKELENFKITSFQKKILRRNPNFKHVFIGRFEIEEENGFWKLNHELKNKIISEGGEAIIFLEKFGNLKAAVRIHIFDAFLFTTNFGANELKWKTNLISDFEKADDGLFTRGDDKAVVPIHENIVRNYANVELFQIGDEKEEDCLGWITILEKCDGNIRTELKNEKLDLEERKKIAVGLQIGFKYLEKIGIFHFDKKLENFLLLGGVVKICDFGLVWEFTGRKSYRQMGYCRRGSKFRDSQALFSGSPGFSNQQQLGNNGYEKNYFYFLICDWKTSWSLLYRPIDENERKIIDKIIKIIINDESQVIKNISKIISLRNISNSFCLDDPNLTKSCQMSNLKQQMTKCNRDGKLSENKVYQNLTNQHALTKKVMLNENYVFSRPLSVTGAYFLPNRRIDGIDYAEEVFFHQMTLDRIENGEYVLQNTQFSVDHPPVIKIKQTRPYYDSSSFVTNLFNQTGDNFYDDGVLKMKLVNETLFMNKNCWYLLPQAYSLKLNKIYFF